MAIATLTARSSVTTLDKTQGINRHDVAGHPITYYTCPTGKRARIIGTVVCRDRGAATSVNFVVAGIIMFTWNTNISQITVNRSAEWTPRGLSTFSGGFIAPFDVVLEAGETLSTSQSSGDNAEIDFNAEVQELPA